MMDGPDVSVAIVAWRARDYVIRCLESLERDADVSYEAIVVDDGSGDGTPEAVRARFPDAVVVAKERNEGLCAGRNDAVARVRGPVVWVAGAAQMWRATLPQQIGAYDPTVSSYGGEDLDWCLRVWAAGLEVRYVPSAEIVHVWQKVTRRRQFGRQSLRAFRDWYYLQWKHRALRGSPMLAEANR